MKNVSKLSKHDLETMRDGKRAVIAQMQEAIDKPHKRDDVREAFQATIDVLNRQIKQIETELSSR